MSVCGAKDSKYYPDAQHSTGTYTLLRSEQEVPSTRIYMFTNTNTDTHTNTPCFEQNNGGGWVLNQSLPVLHHVGDFNANASANAQYLKSMVDKDATSVEFLCVKNNFEFGQLHERHGRGCQESTTCLEICGSVHDGVVGQMREWCH
jgi:hypothetical protein